MLTRDSIDLEQSWIAEIDDRPVAIALIAQRGWTARLASMGVAAEVRGQGIGKALLEKVTQELIASETREFVCEVVEQNAPAVSLYQNAGFETIRRLLGFQHSETEAGVAETQLEEVDIAEVARQLSIEPLADLPWQLSAPGLVTRSSPYRAFTTGTAFAVVSDPANPLINLLSLVTRPDHRRQGEATRLVETLLHSFPGKSWSASALWPEELAPIFTANGFQVGEISQLQLKKRL